MEADAKQNDSKCFVESRGSVNCSSSVYEDEQSWKKSRHHVDLLIQTLKQKIAALKDIRRHLKENKPKNVLDQENDSIENASEAVLSEEIDGRKESIEVGANVKPPKRMNDTNKQNRRVKITPTKENDGEVTNKPSSIASKGHSDSNVVATTMRTISRKANEQENRRAQHNRGQENRSRNTTRSTKAINILKATTKLPAPLTTTSTTTTTTKSTTMATPTNQAKLTPTTGKKVDSIAANNIHNRNHNGTAKSIISTMPSNNEEHTTIPYEKPAIVDEQSRTECYCEPDADEM